MTGAYNIYEAIKNLMIIDPFYGNLSIQLDKSFSDEVDTACVTMPIEGINLSLLVNEKYYNKLDNNRRVGLIQHEMLHIAYFHLFMVHKYPNKDIFNIAADLCINQYIRPENLDPNWITFDKFPDIYFARNESTDYYYQILDNNKDSSPNLVGLLNHIKSNKPYVCSHKAWYNSEVSDTMKELIKKQIEYQMVDIYENILNKNPGRIPGHLYELFSNYNKKAPPVYDWKAAIRLFGSSSNKIAMKMSRNKLNKRYEDSDFPGPYIRRNRKILTAIDTSGSVNKSELNAFFDQIHHIWKTGTHIDIIQCDADIHSIETYKGKREKIVIKGRGGTSFDPPVEYLNKKKYNGLIYFTDGYGYCSIKKLKPVLWVVSRKSDYSKTLPGKVVYINV